MGIRLIGEIIAKLINTSIEIRLDKTVK